MLIDEEPDTNYENARRQHYEYYAPALVQAWWLRLFCAGLVAALLLLGLGSLRTAKQLRKQKIIVLSAAHDGSFDRVQYVDMTDYQPDRRVMEHFAYLWATKYYSRLRLTIADDYTQSLEFFSPAVVQELKTVAEQTQWIQQFRDDLSQPEVRVQVRKIRLEPRGISIDFEKHFFLNGRETPGSVENWTSQVTYSLMPVEQVANSMIPVNPIGLRITARPVETKGF